jgi:hypothetical protein
MAALAVQPRRSQLADVHIADRRRDILAAHLRDFHRRGERCRFPLGAKAALPRLFVAGFLYLTAYSAARLDVWDFSIVAIGQCLL